MLNKFLTPYKKLPLPVYVLFFASIINNMGNFVAPFLTMFLTYKVGINVATVGIVVAVNSVFGLLGSLIGGKVIDKIGRKVIFTSFRTISAISIGLCAFIESPMLITMLITVSSFVSGISLPVYSTIITDLTSGDQRKTAFSLEYMAINIGFAVGPLLAAFLYTNYLPLLFLGDATTTLISVILVGFLVPETLHVTKSINSKNKKSLEEGESGSLLAALLKRPTLIIFSLIIVIYFIVFSQFNFGLSLQIGDLFVDNSATIFASLMTVNAVMCSIFPMFLNSIIKNIKPSLCISIGGLLYALGFGMMFTINHYFLFIISTIIWTLGEILVATNTSVYIASHTPISHRGRFNSIFPIIRKLGFIIGPMIAGGYIKYFDIRALWIFIAFLALIGSISMYKLYRIDEKISSIEFLTE